jgi:two-component system, LuxR family, sensor kinase FixL
VVLNASERLHERERWANRSSMASSQIAVGAVLHELRNLSATAALLHANLQRVPNLRLQGDSDFEALGTIVKTLAKIASAELRPGDASNRGVDLNAVLEQLRIILDRWFQESDVRVVWNIAPILPQVWGDEPGLMQIFMNLSQNSAKAMAAGDQKRLTISAAAEGSSVVVRFADTGPGIAAPDELFQPFQTGAGMKRLGLYLSRAIARSMNGDLKCEPVPVGSCFTVELLPLREWLKVESEYGDARAAVESAPRR